MVGQFPIDFRLLGEKITMCHRDDDGVRENRSTHAPLFIFCFFPVFPFIFWAAGADVLGRLPTQLHPIDVIASHGEWLS